MTLTAVVPEGKRRQELKVLSNDKGEYRKAVEGGQDINWSNSHTQLQGGYEVVGSSKFAKGAKFTIMYKSRESFGENSPVFEALASMVMEASSMVGDTHSDPSKEDLRSKGRLRLVQVIEGNGGVINIAANLSFGCTGCEAKQTVTDGGCGSARDVKGALESQWLTVLTESGDSFQEAGVNISKITFAALTPNEVTDLIQ